MEMKRQAVSYLRVSGQGQVEGDGFPRQREAIRRYAKTNRLELVGEFRDEGVSGARDLDNREGLSELVAKVKANGVRVVLVERADRLARDLLVSEVLLAEFSRLGVRVVTADGTDLTSPGTQDPTRTLVRQVLGAVAEFEKSALVSKLRSARIRKKKISGKCEGRKAYGEKPGEAETVMRIRQLYRKPRNGTRPSLRSISHQLNAGGILTRSGKQWAPQTIRNIVNRKTAYEVGSGSTVATE